jgi:hypothetical protein
VVARVLGDISATDTVKLVANWDTGNTGEPTYYSQPTDPLFTLHCTKPWGTCPIEGMAIRIPAGADVEGGAATAGPTTDRHLTVVDQANGWEYDLWQVQTTDRLPVGGGPLNFSWGGRTRIDGDGLAAPPVDPSRSPGAATASYFGSLAGRVRAEELEAGQINHALFIVINCGSSKPDPQDPSRLIGDWVYPAQRGDQICSAVGRSDTNAPPMGARFRLNMTVSEINSLDPTAFPAWKKTLLRAAATYGMFFGDTGSSFYFSIETEAGNQYTSLGSPDRWLSFATNNGWSPWAPDHNYVGELNGTVNGQSIWTRLQMLDPCVSQATC